MVNHCEGERAERAGEGLTEALSMRSVRRRSSGEPQELVGIFRDGENESTCRAWGVSAAFAENGRASQRTSAIDTDDIFALASVQTHRNQAACGTMHVSRVGNLQQSEEGELTLPHKRIQEGRLQQIGEVDGREVIESSCLGYELLQLDWQSVGLSR